MAKSAEQLAIALMAQARRMYQMGGSIGPDEHGFRAMGDRLAGWASDIRQLGVDRLTERNALDYARGLAVIARNRAETKLDRVRSVVADYEDGDDDAKARAFFKIAEVFNG